MEYEPQQFSSLFNKYRLRAGFETLAEFGEKLATEGFIYDDSVFSRWKNGSRKPRNRWVVIAMIKIFVLHGGINTAEEANEILYSLELRGLYWSEIKAMLSSNNKTTHKKNPMGCL